MQGGVDASAEPRSRPARAASTTVAMFRQCGFQRQRRIAKHRWVVVRQVEAA